MISESLLSTTESVCPVCLQKIPAVRVAREGNVYLRKTCPDHGTSETVIWRGMPDYQLWVMPKIPTSPKVPSTPIAEGCPYDCGLCPDHHQEACCVLLEVTQRCNLGCPVCFAASGHTGTEDPTLATIEGWFSTLLGAGGPYNIQLSGGEPCMRDDLPQIITLGKSLGFEFFQVNTNGLRLAEDGDYLHTLKKAGLSVVYLQFDGTKDLIYEALRGRPILDQKIRAIERCIAEDIGVVLVPTIFPGINDDDIGNILHFALKFHPGVRGIHFQPVSYFGRVPMIPKDENRITLPEIVAALDAQSDGLVKMDNFKPANAENSRCTFHGNFVVMEDGSLHPLTHYDPSSCCGKPVDANRERIKAQAFVARSWAKPEPVLAAPKTKMSLGGWDTFLTRSRTHLLAISGMAFQDAWTFDLDRVRECHIITVSPDGRLIPFCAYNLTSQDGKPLYRGK